MFSNYVLTLCFHASQIRYESVWKIIDEKLEAQLHRPLSAIVYFLNPQLQYSLNLKTNVDIKIRLYYCLHCMGLDPSEILKIELQMDAFKNAKGLFSRPNNNGNEVQERSTYIEKSFPNLNI